jgi:hypothetical protein
MDETYDWEPAMAELRTRILRYEAMEGRARQLAVTPTLGGAAMTQAAAGRYVLGLSAMPVQVTS